jgi:hypothetical protein
MERKMIDVKIIEGPVVPPPKNVVITLSYEEAAALRHFLGNHDARKLQYGDVYGLWSALYNAGVSNETA